MQIGKHIMLGETAQIADKHKYTTDNRRGKNALISKVRVLLGDY